MRKFWNLIARDRRFWQVAVLLALGLSLLAGHSPSRAQGEGRVQELTGRIEPGEIVLYLLPALTQGQALSVHARTVSGNLDPAVGVVSGDTDTGALETAFEQALDRAIASGDDPLHAIEEIRERYLLAWDDDSGGGLRAALEYEIPTDGDYRLLVAGALSALGGATFGDYSLLLGLDAPPVLGDDVVPTGEPFAMLDVEATPPGVGVQEISGTLTAEKPSTFLLLQDFKPGDTLYARIEAASGDLLPTLVLSNFARKPVRSGNLDGADTQASLEYTFPAEARNSRLEIAACCGDESPTTGDYRLLVGVNAPDVLAGVPAIGGRMVVREPVEVKVGLKLEQMIEVDHQSEFFTAVASLRMEWTDPALAFNPEECQCDFKSYSDSDFPKFLADSGGKFPEFSLENQQGNRWRQNRTVVVFSDGRAIYFEKFTTNFQVDFDFRKYPFDSQEFVIKVDAIFPEEFYVFSELEGFSEISTGHGEDEFILSDITTHVTTVESSSGAIASRYIFSFSAPRHLSYYVFRVFIPILLIIIVSWVTFFLRDYGRRIEVATGNLFVFIAFSFSLADNYPRLGYVTFLDALMAVMFVINALVVAYNVWLKRLEMMGQADRADRIDSVLDWMYPVTYMLLIGVIIWRLF